MPALIALAINILLAIWVHQDAKGLRSKGAPVIPGIWSTLVFLGSLPLLLIYLLVRVVSYSPKSKEGLPPLPPAAGWTNWLTVIMLLIFITIILVVVLVFSDVHRNRVDFVQPPVVSNSTSTQVTNANPNIRSTNESTRTNSSITSKIYQFRSDLNSLQPALVQTCYSQNLTSQDITAYATYSAGKIISQTCGSGSPAFSVSFNPTDPAIQSICDGAIATETGVKYPSACSYY